MEIVKGKVSSPLKAVVYGPEGIGKTTLASKFPSPLFIDFEGGTGRYDVARVTPSGYQELLQFLGKIDASFEYKTLVFDTADWAEKMITDHMLMTVPNDKGQMMSSVEQYGFGKGYAMLSEIWKKLLDKLSNIADKFGINILFLAHSTIKRVDPPNENPYDRWEMKLGSKSSPLLKEWAELVLFCNYELIVVEKKAQGGKRVMYSQHSPCWDAKNRFGLPEKMDLDFSKISQLLNTVPAKQVEALKTEAKPVPAQAPLRELPKVDANEEIPMEDPEKGKLLDQLSKLMVGSGIKFEALDAELSKRGIVPKGTNPRQFNIETLKRVVGNWDKVTHNIKMSQSPVG